MYIAYTKVLYERVLSFDRFIYSILKENLSSNSFVNKSVKTHDASSSFVSFDGFIHERVWQYILSILNIYIPMLEMFHKYVSNFYL